MTTPADPADDINLAPASRLGIGLALRGSCRCRRGWLRRDRRLCSDRCAGCRVGGTELLGGVEVRGVCVGDVDGVGTVDTVAGASAADSGAASTSWTSATVRVSVPSPGIGTWESSGRGDAESLDFGSLVAFGVGFALSTSARTPNALTATQNAATIVSADLAVNRQRGRGTSLTSSRATASVIATWCCGGPVGCSGLSKTANGSSGSPHSWHHAPSRVGLPHSPQ